MIYKKNLNKYIYILAVIGILAAGIFFRIKIYLFNQGLWGDEIALVLNFFDKNYLDLFKPLDNYQVAPPLFLVFSKFFFDIGKNTGNINYADLGARFFPLISSILSVPLFYITVKKISKNKAFILLCCIIFCYNPVAISYSQELKQYSTELLFAIILAASFLSMNFKKDSTLKTLGHTFIFCLAPWFSSSSVFIIAVVFLYLIFDCIKNKYLPKNLLIFSISLFFNFMLYYFVYYKEVSAVYLEYMRDCWCYGFLSFHFMEIFKNQTQGLLPFFRNPMYHFIFLILGFRTLFFEKRNKIFFMILSVFILVITASLMKYYPFEQRLILFLLPFYIILYSSLMLTVKKEKDTAAYIIFAVFLFTTVFQFEFPASDNIIHRCASKEQYGIIEKDKSDKSTIIGIDPSFVKYYSKIKKIKKTFELISYEVQTEYDFNKLDKNQTYYYAMPSTAGITRRISIRTKEAILNNENFEIVEKYEAPYNKDIYLIKFRKIK